jgi:hypothetical protein
MNPLTPQLSPWRFITRSVAQGKVAQGFSLHELRSPAASTLAFHADTR